MSVPTKEKPRTQQTVRDLVISMVLVGAFVAFLFLMVLRPTPDPVREVDTASAAQVAAAEQAFDILVPQGLSDQWRATSARYRPGPVSGTGSWFNGYVDPDGDFVAVAQQNYDQREFLRTYLEDAEQVGARPVGDQVWLEFRNADKGETTLVLEGGLPSSGQAGGPTDGAESSGTEESQTNPQRTTTVLVTGTAPPEELAQFASKLAPFSA